MKRLHMLFLLICFGIFSACEVDEKVVAKSTSKEIITPACEKIKQAGSIAGYDTDSDEFCECFKDAIAEYWVEMYPLNEIRKIETSNLKAMAAYTKALKKHKVQNQMIQCYEDKTGVSMDNVQLAKDLLQIIL